MRKKSKPRLSKWFGVGLLLACLSSQAGFAADLDVAATATATGKALPPIAVVLSQYKLAQDAQGAPQWIEAISVVPGDVMEYHATYSNQSNSAVSVIATLPVPEALEYIANSATAESVNNSPIAHTVALNDAQFAPEPLMRKEITPDGGTILRAVPAAEYRFVRWDLENMPAGTSVEVRLRAKVTQTQAQPAEAAQP